MNSSRLLTLRIIHLALLMGCLMFGVIAVVMRQQQQASPPNPPLVSYVGIALAASTGLAYLLMPSMMLNPWRRRLAQGTDDSDEQYANMLQTHFIVGAALLEGTVFYQLVAYLTEGQPWTLGLAAFFWLLLLLKFPTETGTHHWIEALRDRVALMRSTGM